MIKLEVEYYCQDCPYFGEETQKLFYDNKCDTIIICEHRGMCEDLYKRFTEIDKAAPINPDSCE